MPRKMETDEIGWIAFCVILSAAMLSLIGWGFYEAFASGGMEKTQERQEQQFANTFYAQCQEAKGIYSSGNTGYVCFKDGTVLFQSSAVDHHSVK